VLALAGAASSSPSHELTFTVELRLDTARIDRDLAAGRRISSPAELGRRYGLPLASERRGAGVPPAHAADGVCPYPARAAGRAPPAAIHRFFHGGVPRELRPYVSGVLLSQRPVAFANDLPHGTLLPGDAALAYDITPLHKAGIDGSGQTVAILSLSAFPSDLR